MKKSGLGGEKKKQGHGTRANKKNKIGAGVKKGTIQEKHTGVGTTKRQRPAEKGVMQAAGQKRWHGLYRVQERKAVRRPWRREN